MTYYVKCSDGSLMKIERSDGDVLDLLGPEEMYVHAFLPDAPSKYRLWHAAQAFHQGRRDAVGEGDFEPIDADAFDRDARIAGLVWDYLTRRCAARSEYLREVVAAAYRRGAIWGVIHYSMRKRRPSEAKSPPDGPASGRVAS